MLYTRELLSHGARLVGFEDKPRQSLTDRLVMNVRSLPTG
jgi:hypothetical protein